MLTQNCSGLGSPRQTASAYASRLGLKTGSKPKNFRKNTLKRAGITDFRWHDLRHTWASWHVQNGTPLNALQELADMVRRYAHLGQNHLAHYAENLCHLD